jgi:hypothetical protein
MVWMQEPEERLRFADKKSEITQAEKADRQKVPFHEQPHSIWCRRNRDHRRDDGLFAPMLIGDFIELNDQGIDANAVVSLASVVKAI